MRNFIYYIAFAVVSVFIYSCGEKPKEIKTPLGTIEYSRDRSEEIQRYNQKLKESQAGNRNPCDTLSLMAYIIKNYPPGSYLVDFDKTLTYNIPRPAVIYLNDNGGTYILGVITRSKPGERLIEPKNVVGYYQSFIDQDSTKLGTAFFYLTLFKCDNGTFTRVWEAPIPDHGGFNNMSVEKWGYNGTPYVKVDFHYAGGSGHIDYNYFLINGLTQQPHLLMTYKGIDFQRTITNFNNDKYPDYYEYVYVNLADRIYPKDSVAFVWNVKDSVYINTRNRRQTRPY